MSASAGKEHPIPFWEEPVSQKNLSPGNCVAVTVFPKEIMSLTINVVTIYPKEIMSPGNTVAHMLDIILYTFFEVSWISLNTTYC